MCGFTKEVIHMRMPKRVLALTSNEYRLMLYGLIHWRNKLLSQGRYTDAVDELLIKIQKIRNI